MAYGVKGLRQLRIGKETTGGTAVAPTSLPRWEGVITDDLKVIFPKEDVGIAGGTDRSYIPELAAMISLTSSPATFETLGYILNMGIAGVAGVADGVGTDFIYTRAHMTTAQKVPYYYTIEGGNNAEAERMEFCFVKDYVIEGKINEAVMRTANIIGRQAAINAFSGSPTTPTVEEILYNKGKIYIDAVGGTIGTTQVTNTLQAFKITVTTGFVGVPSFDGSLYFSFVKQVAPIIKIDFTFEHETQAIAQKVAWRAQTPKQIRLLMQGSAVATPGTTYTYKTFIYDVAGKWEKFGPLTDDAGDDRVVGTFHVGYNATAALYANTVLVNELSALP